MILLLATCGSQYAQEATVFRAMAEALTEQLIKKGGTQAAEELAQIGGEKAAEDLLEKAAQEGGQDIAQKLAGEASEYGVVILKAAKPSPAKFVAAFEELAPELRTGAVEALGREPEAMSGLVSQFGKDALEVGARHPGVGVSLMETFGKEGVEIADKLSRDEGIQLARLSKEIAAVPASEQNQLMKMIGQAPGKVLDLLEEHPRVLTTAAGLTAFLAAKDQILGPKPIIIDPDGTIRPAPGLAEKVIDKFRRPLTAVIGIIGLAIASWAGIRAWAAYRVLVQRK